MPYLDQSNNNNNNNNNNTQTFIISPPSDQSQYIPSDQSQYIYSDQSQYVQSPLPPQPTENGRFALLPLKGILYFFSHPQLWCLGLGFVCAAVLGFILIFTLISISSGAQFGLFDQLFASDFSAAAVTVVAILSENVIFLYIFIYVVLLPCIMDRLFRSVFQIENVPWNPVKLPCCKECLTDCGRCCAIQMICISVLILTLPLILVPVFGPFLWSAASSFFTAWDILDRYFGHKKISFSASWAFAKYYKVRFFLFGFVVMLLTMVPFLQLILMYTNLVSGALWACEIERTGALRPFIQDQDFLYNDSVELSEMGSGDLEDQEASAPFENESDQFNTDHETLLNKSSF